ncbi:MAG: hypothetical protein NUK65_13565 [Firmicutes bacterium]|nr:hypothetical protein [Bacillota bacterium]
MTKATKIGLTLLSICLLLSYGLFIIFANRSHQFFILENPIYNEQLHYNNNLSKMFMSLYIIGLHLAAVVMFYMHEGSKIRGLLYLNIGEVILWILCLALAVLLDFFSFKPSADILQFLVIQVSTNITYLLFVLVNKKKHKYISGLHN